jgi:hypothetical protein
LHRLSWRHGTACNGLARRGRRCCGRVIHGTRPSLRHNHATQSGSRWSLPRGLLISRGFDRSWRRRSRRLRSRRRSCDRCCGNRGCWRSSGGRWRSRRSRWCFWRWRCHCTRRCGFSGRGWSNNRTRWRSRGGSGFCDGGSSHWSCGRTRSCRRGRGLLGNGLEHVAGLGDLRQVNLGLDLFFGARRPALSGLGRFGLAGKVLAYPHRLVGFNGAGVGFLLRDPYLDQGVKDCLTLYFQLSCQIVDSNLLHSAFSFLRRCSLSLHRILTVVE